MRVPPRVKDRDKESAEAETAQAEFLDDIRVSLKEMRAGQVLPAADALELLEEGLDDDELASRLPE